MKKDIPGKSHASFRETVRLSLRGFGVWRRETPGLLLSLDFADMENGHVQELRSRIWQNTDSGGWGLYKLIYSFEAVIRSVMSMAGGFC